MNPSSTENRPHLSVIVPVLNEQGTVGPLLLDLAQQQGLAFELIICDGGSTDSTLTEVEHLATELPFPVQIISSGKGRGRQMNAGAARAAADYLLFLHADSRLPAADTLAYAVATLVARKDCRVAGHFALRFSSETSSSASWYYFHACKARLHRPGCTHGDQGWLLHRTLFAEVGPFDESLPFLEDARLAPLIARHGQWLLIDREIVTSSRRFESEGIHRRQALNALIMACHETGFTSLLAEIPAIYRQQQETGMLTVIPFFARFYSLAAALPATERSRLWQTAGRFIADNAWQAALLIDIRRGFKHGHPAGSTPFTTLDFFDRHLAGRLRSRTLHLILGVFARLILAAITITRRSHVPM